MYPDDTPCASCGHANKEHPFRGQKRGWTDFAYTACVHTTPGGNKPTPCHCPAFTIDPNTLCTGCGHTAREHQNYRSGPHGVGVYAVKGRFAYTTCMSRLCKCLQFTLATIPRVQGGSPEATVVQKPVVWTHSGTLTQISGHRDGESTDPEECQMETTLVQTEDGPRLQHRLIRCSACAKQPLHRAHMARVEAVNREKNPARRMTLLIELRAWRDGVVAALGMNEAQHGCFLMEADQHYIALGVTRDMCAGVWELEPSVDIPPPAVSSS